MKAMKRRLLSLFLAMVMVCSLLPTALATVTASITQGNQTIESGGEVTLSVSVSDDTTPPPDTTTTYYYDWTLGNGLAYKTGSQNGASSITIVGTNNTAQNIQPQVSCTVKETNASGNTVATASSVTVTVKPEQSSLPVTPTSLSISPVQGSPLTVGSSGKATVVATVTGTQGSQSNVPVEGATINVTASGTSAVVTSGNGSKTDAQGKVTIEVSPASGGVTGATSFTVTCGQLASQTFSVTVNPAVGSVSITLGNNSIPIGGTGVVAIATPASGVDVTGSTISWTQSGTGKVSITGNNTNTVTIVGQTAGTVTLKATYKKGETTIAEGTANLTVNANTGVYIATANGTTGTVSLAGIGSQTTLYAYVGGQTNQTTYIYRWQVVSGTSVSLSSSNYYSANIYASSSGVTYIRVLVYNKDDTSYLNPIGSADVAVSVGNSGMLISVTVNGDSDYLFSDQDDTGKASVYDQICSAVQYSKAGRSLYSVSFESTTSIYGNLENANNAYNATYYADGVGTTGARLSQLVFTPKQAGTAQFTFYAYYKDYPQTSSNNYLIGTLQIKVDSTATTGDIPYTASIGDDVYFDMGDFEDFYYTKTSRGTLEYVTFTTPSGGRLYGDRTTLNSSEKCYVNPRSNQTDLNSVYFSPTGTTATKAGTVRISFTAYGNKSNVSGTVAITYLNGAAKDINYSTVNGKVTLDPQDFIDAYKEVTGKTAPSGLTIQFQEIPANGTLTYTGGSKDKDLTKSTVRSNKYATRGSGSYRVDQLVYTGTRGKDTIEYIAYSGSSAQFTGKVVFNGATAPTDVVVTYGSTGGQAVRFSQNDFVRANSALSNASTIRFTTPTSGGSLLMNGVNAAGVDIAVSLLGNVSYQPKAGYNGSDRIVFMAYDARSTVVASGSVNITIVGNPTTTTPGTPGGVTDVSQFKDVSSTAWYRNDLATLVSQGIITGKGEGKFDPLGTVTYGEALKMVLEAYGYTATLGTGSQWAINYKNLAVSKGWISSSIDLNAPISRNATAELAAKVMGVAAATSGSPFADEANAYAVALYYTNPQIFGGSPNPNGGKPLFKNGSPLLRQEVCAVICRIRTYYTQHTTNTMPDGI